MAVRLEALDFWAAYSTSPFMLTARSDWVRKIREDRIDGARISAERIALLLDNDAVADIYESTRAIRPGEAAEPGALVKPAFRVRFNSNAAILDEIEFDGTPAGREHADRFVELFNRAGREGYCR